MADGMRVKDKDKEQQRAQHKRCDQYLHYFKAPKEKGAQPRKRRYQLQT